MLDGELLDLTLDEAQEILLAVRNRATLIKTKLVNEVPERTNLSLTILSRMDRKLVQIIQSKTCGLEDGG